MGPPSYDSSQFLNDRFGLRYLCWNLSDEPSNRMSKPLHSQICDFHWSAPGKSQTPCLDALFKVCYSIKVCMEVSVCNVYQSMREMEREEEMKGLEQLIFILECNIRHFLAEARWAIHLPYTSSSTFRISNIQTFETSMHRPGSSCLPTTSLLSFAAMGRQGRASSWPVFSGTVDAWRRRWKASRSFA